MSPMCAVAAGISPIAGLQTRAYTRFTGMPHRICPNCHIQGRLLEAASSEAYVEYYRCAKCGHVWTHEKGNPDAPPRDVTLPRKTGDE